MSLSPIPKTIQESGTIEKVSIWVLENNALFEFDVSLFINVMLHTFYSSFYDSVLRTTFTQNMDLRFFD